MPIVNRPNTHPGAYLLIHRCWREFGLIEARKCSCEFLHPNDGLTLALLWGQRSAVLSVKLFKWAVFKKAASSSSSRGWAISLCCWDSFTECSCGSMTRLNKTAPRTELWEIHCAVMYFFNILNLKITAEICLYFKLYQFCLQFFICPNSRYFLHPPSYKEMSMIQNCNSLPRPSLPGLLYSAKWECKCIAESIAHKPLVNEKNIPFSSHLCNTRGSIWIGLPVNH